MISQQDGWIQEARRVLIGSEINHFQVKAWRYWLDFGLSVFLAYGLGSIFLAAPLGSWRQLVAFPIAVFWLYRLGSLVHEVCHLGQHEMRAFKVAWNLVVGVVTLTPSPFFTGHHRDHHSQRMYGTMQDPEYVIRLFRPGNPLSILTYILTVALFPIVVFLRFVLAPLTFLHPRLREWTLRRTSSLTMNWRYERRVTAFDRWAITSMELLCCLRAIWMPAGVLLGVMHWTRLPLFYSLGLGVLVLNQMRQLADHHFESDGSNMELPNHIGDSCNFTGRDFFTWLFFPFSIRYHALHHLFPSLPYHNLAAAHACLLEGISADSPYRGLDQSSWWSVASQTLSGSTKPPIL